ncbi:hypothetical protein C8R45DRAFT_932673 [Mycena sanguinolenta]|nr:hypothetical protein C8R45DRAFT_932673 [Mycena sanguinolenta]
MAIHYPVGRNIQLGAKVRDSTYPRRGEDDLEEDEIKFKVGARVMMSRHVERSMIAAQMGQNTLSRGSFGEAQRSFEISYRKNSSLSRDIGKSYAYSGYFPAYRPFVRALVSAPPKTAAKGIIISFTVSISPQDCAESAGPAELDFKFSEVEHSIHDVRYFYLFLSSRLVPMYTPPRLLEAYFRFDAPPAAASAKGTIISFTVRVSESIAVRVRALLRQKTDWFKMNIIPIKLVCPIGQSQGRIKDKDKDKDGNVGKDAEVCNLIHATREPIFVLASNSYTCRLRAVRSVETAEGNISFHFGETNVLMLPPAEGIRTK